MIRICVVITVMSESQKSKAKPLTPVWAGILRQEKVNQSARKPELLPFKCKYHGNTELHRFATISHLKKHLASVHHEGGSQCFISMSPPPSSKFSDFKVVGAHTNF